MSRALLEAISAFCAPLLRSLSSSLSGSSLSDSSVQGVCVVLALRRVWSVSC